jgi:hypothetical protein
MVYNGTTFGNTKSNLAKVVFPKLAPRTETLTSLAYIKNEVTKDKNSFCHVQFGQISLSLSVSATVQVKQDQGNGLFPFNQGILYHPISKSLRSPFLFQPDLSWSQPHCIQPAQTAHVPMRHVCNHAL